MDSESAFWLGCFLGGLLTLVIFLPIGGCVEEEVSSKWQNAAVERGYGEIVVENGVRKFRWKEGK